MVREGQRYFSNLGEGSCRRGDSWKKSHIYGCQRYVICNVGWLGWVGCLSARTETERSLELRLSGVFVSVFSSDYYSLMRSDLTKYCSMKRNECWHKKKVVKDNYLKSPELAVSVIIS